MQANLDNRVSQLVRRELNKVIATANACLVDKSKTLGRLIGTEQAAVFKSSSLTRNESAYRAELEISELNDLGTLTMPLIDFSGIPDLMSTCPYEKMHLKVQGKCVFTMAVRKRKQLWLNNSFHFALWSSQSR